MWASRALPLSWFWPRLPFAGLSAGSRGRKGMSNVSPILALLSLAAGAAFGGPAEAVSAAAADTAGQPAAVRPQLRYLSLHAVPLKERAEFLKVLSFHVNSLSREADLVAPVPVGPDVVRINMSDYLWERSVWEKMASLDPYFHVKIGGDGIVVPAVKAVEVPVVPAEVPAVQIEGVQFYRDGRGQELIEVEREDLKAGETVWVRERRGGGIVRRTVPAGKQAAQAPKAAPAKEKAQKADAVAAHAPWLPGQVIAVLAESLNSDAPIVDARWFIWQTAVQKDRKGSGYYDYLQFKKREDLQKAVALDIEAAKRVRKEMAAIVADSGVALNNRQILRFQTLTGGYWATLDANNNEGGRNAVRVLNGDYQHDAEEIYGVLPNGLFAFAASSADGELQETVPDNIAADHVSSSNDKRIHVGLSCIRCHSEGLRPIDDWARKVYRGPVQLASPDYAKLKRLQRLYLSDLPGQLRLDQEAYARSLKSVNGLTSEANARAYGSVWSAYADKPLGLAETAAELACTPAEWKAALESYGKRGAADPLLMGLLVGARMRREYVHESYSLMQTILAQFGRK